MSSLPYACLYIPYTYGHFSRLRTDYVMLCCTRCSLCRVHAVFCINVCNKRVPLFLSGIQGV